jgi:hypothetical protein
MRRAYKEIAIEIALCLALFSVVSTVKALPIPTPTCKPYPIGSGTAIQHATNIDGWAIMWWCDENHLWKGYGSAGFWKDIPADIGSKVIAFLTSGTVSDFDGYWAQVKCNLDDPLCPQAPLAALYHSIPAPNFYPPSGLVTQPKKPGDITTPIYGVSSSKDFNILSPVGSIGLGIACDTKQVTTDGSGAAYFVVPSDNQTIVWKSTPRIRVYAQCY